MCAIFGGIIPESFLSGEKSFKFLDLVTASKSRGRDGTNYEIRPMSDGRVAIVGNSRAAPTTELAEAKLQPYGGFVHNGTISNDRTLGNTEGVDSMVLPKVVSTESFAKFTDTLASIQGSYAIAAISANSDSIYLARNYKPLYVLEDEGAKWFASMPYMLSHIAGRKMIAPVEVPPYYTMDLRTGEARKLDFRLKPTKVLVVASAGLDSTAVATHYASQGKQVTLLHFKYGCRAESRELTRIRQIADYLSEKFATSCKVRVMQLPYSEITSDSPILGDGRAIAGGVEGAEFAFEWVPARNLLMVAAAVAIAEAEGYGVVSLGLNIEESGAYPDNEEDFTRKLNELMPYAVSTKTAVKIECPYDRFTKKEIVQIGTKLGAPFHLTWSCYRGGETHCGACGPCFMRANAFKRNGLIDPVM